MGRYRLTQNGIKQIYQLPKIRTALERINKKREGGVSERAPSVFFKSFNQKYG